MPHLTGSELVAAIRKRGVTSKIIVLSAHVTEEIRRAYEQFDVQHIFEKPFDLAEFRAAVDAQGMEFARWKTAIKLRELATKKKIREVVVGAISIGRSLVNPIPEQHEAESTYIKDRVENWTDRRRACFS
jgi:DNA-binding response OmpR family regulator